MALQTDSSRTECYEFAQMVHQGDIVLFSDPMMVYPVDNVQENCSLLLETCGGAHFTQGFDIRTPVYNQKIIEFDNNFQAEHDGCLQENKQVKEGLTMVEILHSTNSFSIEDKPSYVDISEIKTLINHQEEGPIIISDDDDVIFVDCYKETDSSEKNVTKRNSYSFSKRSDTNKIRRNPVRSTRNKSRGHSKDVLFEEDFAFLDTSDGDADEKENVASEKTLEAYKEWPINVHERPEYIEKTNTIESFDYTIRDIQKKGPVSKKAKLETAVAKKKPKKKYGSVRRRNARTSPVEKRVPVDDLKTAVNLTTILLKDFFERTKESKQLLPSEPVKFRLEDKLQVLTNQVTLYAAVNDLDLTDVLKDIFPVVNSERDS